MRKHVPDLRRSLALCAGFGAVLGLLLLLQVSMTFVTSAGQLEGETYAPQVPHPGSTETVASCIELTEATLVGPPTGTVGISYTFAVTVGPTDADWPITYFWQATEQLPEAHPLLNRFTDTMQFTWDVTGLQQVSVTAENVCGLPISQSYTITIEAETWYTFLPLALKSYFHDPYEPNDDRQQAFGELLSGTPYSAYFPGPEDTDDYYFIIIETKKPIDIHLTVPDSLDLDVWLYHHSAPGAVAGSATPGLGIDEVLEYMPEQTGKYYIRLYRAEGWDQASPYTLVVTYDTL